MNDCRNETEANLALAATAYDAAIAAASPGAERVAAIAAADDQIPIRKPGEARDVPIGEAIVPPAAVPVTIGRDDIRPGMRMIGGEWFYSSRWL